MFKRVPPKHTEWVPHGYQRRAVEHLATRGSGALFLDPGMGKTSITLGAFQELRERGLAKTMLVIAPLRVCQLVWRQEAQKWTQFRDLKFSLLHGERKADALRANADVFLINPEGVAWLCDLHYGKRLPFDVICIDELTKFKNSAAQRSKKLIPHADKAKYRWGLTGTPAPNGYMDLFGQMRILDGGAALGKFITRFRDRYFQPGRDGFSYELRDGAASEIEDAIEPYVMYASADDYLSLPPLVEHRIELDLPKDVRKVYTQMKRDMMTSIAGQTLTAANAAVVYSKLKQMANGAIYVGDDKYEKLHDVKLDALADLVEELGGKPLLVAYEFRHDLSRLLERFPGTPYLGGGISGAKAEQIEKDWNDGRLPLLFAHPASAGHGLNLQKGGAGHLCWFSLSWDYELYDQFIRRIHRQGTTAERVVMHKLIVKDSMDEIVSTALDLKETTQDRLLAALKSEIVRDDPAAKVNIGEDQMKRIGSPSAAAPVQPAPAGWGASAPAQPVTASPAPAATAPATPVGWGAPAATPAAPAFTAPAAPAPAPAGWGTQQAISTGAERVDPAQSGTSLFSPEVQAQIATVGQPVPVEEKAPRKRRTKTEIEAERAANTAAEEEVSTAPVGFAAPYRPTDFHVQFDAGFTLVELTKAGVALDDALSAVGAVIDHLREKE